jgi:hypothetical protein
MYCILPVETVATSLYHSAATIAVEHVMTSFYVTVVDHSLWGGLHNRVVEYVQSAINM